MGKLRQLFRAFATWDVLDWTAASAAEFAALKSEDSRRHDGSKNRQHRPGQQRHAPQSQFKRFSEDDRPARFRLAFVSCRTLRAVRAQGSFSKIAGILA